MNKEEKIKDIEREGRSNKKEKEVIKFIGGCIKWKLK